MSKSNIILTIQIIIIASLLAITFLFLEDYTQNLKKITNEVIETESYEKKLKEIQNDTQILELRLSEIKYELLQQEYEINKKHFDYVIKNKELIGESHED